MDSPLADAVALLKHIGHEITIPTATWLFCERYQIIASEARQMIGDLENAGWITIDNGGWIKVK